MNIEALTHNELMTAYQEQTRKIEAVVAENVKLKETLEYIVDGSNQPEYHEQGMGCGLEDRGITDRYEAMYHGWECAMERVYSEVIPDVMPKTPATDSVLAKIEARGVEKHIEALKKRKAELSESLPPQHYRHGNSELKPCIFCGNDDVQRQPCGMNGYSVRCLSCGARGPAGFYDDCIEAWNLRTSDSEAHHEE